MNDSPAIIKYGSRALLDYQNTQKMSDENAQLFLAYDSAPAVIESLCFVKNRSAIL